MTHNKFDHIVMGLLTAPCFNISLTAELPDGTLEPDFDNIEFIENYGSDGEKEIARVAMDLWTEFGPFTDLFSKIDTVNRKHVQAALAGLL